VTSENLPDLDAAAREITRADPPSPRLFFLTNRMNLIGVLSSRILAPRGYFYKYYDDLLRHSPGWVPILTSPPSAALLERVVSERGSGAPVLIELSKAALKGRSADGPVVYLPAAQLTDVKAIHFQDTRSLKEHRARNYSNVHPHDHLLEISPELFESDNEVDVSIESPSKAASVDWSELDRVRGAASAALAAADTGQRLAVSATLLGVTEFSSDVFLPSWLNWRELSGDTEPPPPETDEEAADRLIFQSAYRVLGRCDQTESWRPTEVLDAVRADIAGVACNDGVQRFIERNLCYIREIVNVERDFEPFRNRGSRYTAAKAFLMVLLRPDLGQLLEWSTEETGADDTTRVAAAVLAGRLRGLARESVENRNLALDDLTALWAVGVAEGAPQPLGTARVVTGDTSSALLIDEVEVCKSTALIPDPVPLYEAMETGDRHSARIAASRQFGWPVEVRVQVPSDAVIKNDESLITITTTGHVQFELHVDERAFKERLDAAPAQVKQSAVQIFSNHRT